MNCCLVMVIVYNSSRHSLVPIAFYEGLFVHFEHLSEPAGKGYEDLNPNIKGVNIL